MIVSISTNDGIIKYDINPIGDESVKTQAKVSVNKVSTIEVVKEALSIAGVAHRKNLEHLCATNPEALIAAHEEEVEEVETENSTEEETPES